MLLEPGDQGLNGSLAIFAAESVASALQDQQLRRHVLLFQGLQHPFAVPEGDTGVIGAVDQECGRVVLGDEEDRRDRRG